MLRNEEETRISGWILKQYEDRPSLGHKKLAIMKTNTQLKFQSSLSFKTEPLLG